MSERRHLSISQVGMFERCELQWYFRYAQGIKSPPGYAAVIGKGTHKAVEKDLAQKMAWGSLLETAEVRDIAADATRAAWEAEPPVLRDGDLDQGKSVDAAVGLATLHHTALAPKLEPTALEQAFIIPLPELSHDLVGVVDIETPTHIRDTKTKGKAPSWDAARRSTQLIAYSLQARLRRRERAVALDFLLRKRVPEALTVEASPTENEHRALVKRIELVSRSIDSGIFRPAPADAWCCSEKWCGYWEICDHGAKKTVTVGLIDPAHLTAKIIPHPHPDTQEDADVSAA